MNGDSVSEVIVWVAHCYEWCILDIQVLEHGLRHQVCCHPS